MMANVMFVLNEVLLRLRFLARNTCDGSMEPAESPRWIVTGREAIEREQIRRKDCQQRITHDTPHAR